MPLPLDQATTLQSVLDIHKEVYYKDFLEVPFYTGSPTSRLLQFEGEAVYGDGKNFKTKRWSGDHFRFQRDPLAEISDPAAFVPEEVKMRWNERTVGSHDFGRMSGSAQVSDYQLANVNNEGQIVDLADELLGDLRSSFRWKSAASSRLPRTGLIGQVSAGTYSIRKGDNIDYGSCSSYTTDDTSICCVIDNVAPSMIREGVEYDFYSSTTGALQFYRALCTRVNYGDAAEGNGVVAVFERGGSTSDPATADFDDVADNSNIYFSASKDGMPYSPEAWMSRDAASSTFIGGVDRNTPAFGFLNPTIIRQTTTNVSVATEQIAKRHLQQAANTVAKMFDGEMKYRAMAHPDLIDSLRARTEEAFWLSVPTQKTSEGRQINLGSKSLAFQHPAIGQVEVEGDPFMKPDHLDLLSEGDWMMMYYQTKGLRFLPGEIGKNWYRMASSNSNGAKGMFYRCDAYANMGTYCKRAKAQVRVAALSV